MQRATAPRERVLAACAALLLVLVLLLSARLAQLRPPACADAVSSAGGLVLSLPRGPRPWTTAVTRPRSEDGAAFAAAARSQDGEDVYAATRFGLNAIRGGFFVELGALNGLEKSNSFAFEAALGWTGLLIEPGPRNFASLLRNRPRSVLVNAAVCGTFREVHFLEPEEVSRRPVSGIVEFMAPGFIEKWHQAALPNGAGDAASLARIPTVQCMPLQSIFDETKVEHIYFLSVDVEGGELEVLKTIDFSRVKIFLVAVEADGFFPDKEAGVKALLKDAGFSHEGQHLRSDWFVNDAHRRKDHL